MLLVANHSFLVTPCWDIRVGMSQGPRTLITLKCLVTSILNTDKNHLIILTLDHEEKEKLEKQLIVHCAASAVRLRKYRAKKKMEQEQEQIKSTPVHLPDCNIWLPPWSPLHPPSPNHDNYSVLVHVPDTVALFSSSHR
jgi:hypothetical protein